MSDLETMGDARLHGLLVEQLAIKTNKRAPTMARIRAAKLYRAVAVESRARANVKAQRRTDKLLRAAGMSISR